MSENLDPLANDDVLEALQKRDARQAKTGVAVKEARQRYLTFRLGRQWFGIEVQEAREISRLENVTRVPLTPPHILGIVNLRGSIIAVLDIRDLVAVERLTLDDSARIIVVNANNLEAGLLADQVSEVLEVSRSQVETSFTEVASERTKYASGVIQHNGEFLIVLNLKTILSDLKV